MRVHRGFYGLCESERACACLHRRGGRRREAALVLARQATTQDPDAPVSSWSRTVKGTLKRWTASGNDRTTSSNVGRSSTQNGASARGSKTVSSGTIKQRALSGKRGKRGKTVKQTSGETRGAGQPKSSSKGGRYYWNITGFPFPLGPLLIRRTIRYEVGLSNLVLNIAQRLK